MRKYISALLIVSSFFLLTRSITFATGAFATNGLPQTALTESRSIVILDGTKETIISTNTFAINPLIIDNFAWLIPVPGKADVKILQDDAFIQMDKLTQKKFAKNNWLNMILYPDIYEETSQPSQTFTYPVYLKNPQVFSYKDKGKAIQQWLYELGFFIPKNGRTLYKSYIDKKWHFVGAQVDAVHMEMDATDSLIMSGAHTQPLSVSFVTSEPVIPLRFSTLQPDRDSNFAPLSFPYGSSSEAILGAKDDRIDDLLATPSANKFPPVPIDFMNMKIELFIFAENKTIIPGFITAYADWIDTQKYSLKDGKGKYYWKLPQKKMYLTHLYTYKPISQLEDLTIKKANNNNRVNPYISLWEVIFRFILLTLLLISIFNYLKKKFIHS